jgi:uncharacterized protein DUF6364
LRGARNFAIIVLMKRNLTIQLDEATIQKARVAAARRSVSISQLVRDEIKRLADQDHAYEAAKKKALAHLNKPFNLGGQGKLPARDSLHER